MSEEGIDTKILRMDAEAPDPKLLEEAGRCIREGGTVVFPTETVYGLGGDALNPDSSRKIYAAKGRPSDNPLIVHICDIGEAEPLSMQLPEAFYALAEKYWPGPLTMIVRKSDLVPKETTGGLDTVAIRMPSHKIASGLIRCAGVSIAAPSANISGRPSPTIAAHVIEDLSGRVDMIIDGGAVGIGVESTIVDLSGEVPEVLRPGAITREMLEAVCGTVGEDATMMAGGGVGAPRAPGMRYRHYAPKGAMTIVEGDAEAVAAYINEQTGLAEAEGKRVGVLCTEQSRNSYRASLVKPAGERGDEAEAARRLYGILREFDAAGITRIYAESFSREGIGQALMNRMLKAAGYEVVRV